VGDVRNTPGRSLYVRLHGHAGGEGAAGKWTDAATGEHGDLLDLIGASCGLAHFRDVAEEARRFLALPAPARKIQSAPVKAIRPNASAQSARRLLAMTRPIAGTLVETYLRGRGVTAYNDVRSLRFHPRCFYRPYGEGPSETWPAMVAAVTDVSGAITGAHRTWLDRGGRGKAPLETPRRAMGHLLRHAVRFGAADAVMAVGEGIETVLSLGCVAPTLPMAAALSAGHLAALQFPPPLRRLYVACDADPAGAAAMAVLAARASQAGIEAIKLTPRLGDFNEDLRALGPQALRMALGDQLRPIDGARFLQPAP
jgi:hypothetical protein